MHSDLFKLYPLEKRGNHPDWSSVGEQQFRKRCLCDAHTWICPHPYINLPYLSCAVVGGAISNCSVREDKVCFSNKTQKEVIFLKEKEDSTHSHSCAWQRGIWIGLCYDVRKVCIVSRSTLRHPQESKQATAQLIRNTAYVRGTVLNHQSMSQSFKTRLRNRESKQCFTLMTSFLWRNLKKSVQAVLHEHFKLEIFAKVLYMQTHQVNAALISFLYVYVL